MLSQTSCCAIRSTALPQGSSAQVCKDPFPISFISSFLPGAHAPLSGVTPSQQILHPPHFPSVCACSGSASQPGPGPAAQLTAAAVHPSTDPCSSSWCRQRPSPCCRSRCCGTGSIHSSSRSSRPLRTPCSAACGRHHHFSSQLHQHTAAALQPVELCVHAGAAAHAAPTPSHGEGQQ